MLEEMFPEAAFAAPGHNSILLRAVRRGHVRACQTLVLQAAPITDPHPLPRSGVAPAAMINLHSEPIVAVGAIISGIPLVDRVPDDLLNLTDGTFVEVDANSGQIRISQSSTGT